jgi:signal transduction histidine kinase
MYTILLSLMTTVALAQAAVPTKKLEHYPLSTKEGFVSNVVTGMTIDTSGYLIFATLLGLYRYDGQKCKEIPVDESYFTGRAGVSLNLTKEGIPLLASSSGISQIDRSILSTTTFLEFSTHATSQYVQLLHEDSSFLYYLIGRQHVMKVSKQNHLMTKAYDLADSALLGVMPLSNSADSERMIIAIHNRDQLTSELVELSTSSLKIIRRSGYSLNLIACYQVSDSQLLALTNRELLIIDCDDWKIQKRIPLPPQPGNILRGAIARFDSNTYIIGVDREIYEFDLHKKEWTFRYVNVNNKPFLKFGAIKEIVMDAYDNMYVITLNDGLRKLITSKNNFRVYATQDGSSSFAKCIVADKESDNVLIGTFDNGLLIYDTSQVLKYHINDFPNLEGPYRIISISKVGLQKYYVSILGAPKDFIVRIDDGFPEIATGPIVSQREQQSYYTNTQTISERTELFQRNGVVYEIELDQTPYLRLLYDAGLNTLCVYALDGNLITSKFEQVIIHTPGTEAADIIVPLPGLGRVRSITSADQQSFYIGSDHGFLKISLNGEILESNDRIPNQIYSVIADRDGSIWAGSVNGLMHVQKDGTLRTFFVEDGLPDNEFNTNSLFQTSDGEIYMGTTGGAISFYPDQMHRELSPPKTYIAELRVNGLPRSLETIDKNTLYLSYSENTVSFELVAMGQKLPQQYNYQYKMQGVERNWINAGKTANVTYTLKPGKYQFHYTSDESYKRNPDRNKVLYINIEPPFWATTYFKLLAGILIVAIVIYIVSTINNRKLRKNQFEWELQNELQSERNRISRELHDNIGTQIAIIRRNAEWISSAIGEQSLPTMHKLNSISETSNKISRDLRDTIWVSKKAEISVEEFSDRLKSYVHQIGQSHMEIRFHEFIEEDWVLRPEEAFNLFRICQEAIQNAIKHSGASVVQVSIIARNTETLKLKIEDDGIGFELKMADGKGNGLQNMEFRAKETRANLTINSTPDHGCSVLITLRDTD